MVSVQFIIFSCSITLGENQCCLPISHSHYSLGTDLGLSAFQISVVANFKMREGLILILEVLLPKLPLSLAEGVCCSLPFPPNGSTLKGVVFCLQPLWRCEGRVCAVNGRVAALGWFVRRYGAALVAVEASGCPIPPVDSCVWGLLPPGSEEHPGCCPGGRTSLSHGPRHFPGRAVVDLKSHALLGKPLLLIQAENHFY